MQVIKMAKQYQEARLTQVLIATNPLQLDAIFHELESIETRFLKIQKRISITFLLSSTEWNINPIPTGQGRNQPLYERHVTKSSRNRVKKRLCPRSVSLSDLYSMVILRKMLVGIFQSSLKRIYFMVTLLYHLRMQCGIIMPNASKWMQ